MIVVSGHYRQLVVVSVCWLVLLARAQPLPPASRPESGVRLYLGYGSVVLPNYVLLASSQVVDGDSPNDQGSLDGYSDGLFCQSASNSSNAGYWSYPTSSDSYAMVPDTSSDPLPFYINSTIGQVGLAVEGSLQNYSGYYQCEIRDEFNRTYLLYAMLYSTSLYSSYAGPTVDPAMQFTLLSSLDANQTVFSLSFNISNGPPTQVNCTIDGSELGVSREGVVRDVQRTLRSSTDVPDMTLVTVTIRGRQVGVYNCTVFVEGVVNGTGHMLTLGSGSSSTAISAVGMPTNVIVNRTSPFNATISWTGVPETQYIVFYQAADSTVRLNQTTTSYSTPLSNLSPFSDYSVFVVAYSTSGNVLPSLPSSTINLQAAVPAPNISLSTNPPAATLYIGTYIDLVCTLTITAGLDYNVTMQWEGPQGTQLTAGSNYNITSVGQLSSTLRIKQLDASRDDGSAYRCNASVLISDPHLQVNLSTALPLQVNSSSSSLIDARVVVPNVPMSGENFTIFCNLTVPERLSTLPNVLWYESGNFDPLNGNGDQSIVIGNKVFIRSMLQTSFVIASFMFAPLRASDAQSYHCSGLFNHPIIHFATSPTKSVIATIPPPQMIVTRAPPGLLYEQAPITITCSAMLDSSVDITPLVTHTWYGLDNQQLTNTSHITISPVTSSGGNTYSSTMVLGALTVNDSGLYACNSSVRFTDRTILNVSALESINIDITGPPSPPRNLQIGTMSFSLALSWLPPDMPRGDIIQYTLTVVFGNGSDPVVINIQPTAASYVIQGLRPYQLVMVRLSVRTEAGISQDVSQEVLTDPFAAGPVSSLSVRVVNSSTVDVSWSPVQEEEENGALVSYSVSLYINEGRQLQNRSLSANASLQTTFTGLAGETPYSVVVAAVNNAPGEGMPTTKIFFTREGVPRAPADINTQRLNGTHMLVSWSTPSLSESRGFITNYTITYVRSGDRRRQMSSVTVPGTVNSTVIGDLLPYVSYTVSVAATTSAGMGQFSQQVSTQRPQLSVFQLRTADIGTCARLNATSVQSFIKSTVVAAISDRCQCGFTDMFISGERLYCDCQAPTTVIYRANISSFASYTSDNLVGIVQSWLNSGPSVPSVFGRIAFDSQFPVSIASDEGLQCSTSGLAPTLGATPTVADQINLPVIASVAVIGVLLIIILIVILFMFIFLIRMQKKRAKTVVTNSALVLANRDAMFDSSSYGYDVPTKRGSQIEMTSFNKQLQGATTDPADLGAHIYENPDADLDDFKTTPPMYANID